VNSSSSQNSGSYKLTPPGLKWRHWPLRDEWRVHLPIVLVFTLAVVSVAITTQELWVTLATLAIGLVVLWRWWLPVEYEFGSKGISQSYFGWRHLTPWRNIRRFEARPHGVMLFPLADATPLDPLRGLFVPYGTHREDMLQCLAFYVGQNRESLSERRSLPVDPSGRSSQ